MTTIRVRTFVRSYAVTVLERDRDDPLRVRKFPSAVHALHIIRTSGGALEQTDATLSAFERLCTRAHEEIDAAIRDIR